MIQNIRMSFLSFIKEHKFMFIANIFSFSTGLMSFVYFIFFRDDDIKIRLATGFIFLIPAVIIAFASFIEVFTYKKFPKLTKILSFLFNLFVLFVQIFATFFIFAVISTLSNATFTDNLEDYNKSLKQISYKKGIAHFPSVIPEYAENVQFRKYSNPWFGSEEIMLKYDAERSIIAEELKKYKFISIETPEEYKHFSFPTPCDDNDGKNNRYIFYIISDRDHDNKKGFPLHYGIGINDTGEKIIYYYTNPD